MKRNLFRLSAGLLAVVLVALVGLMACTSASTTTTSTTTTTTTTTSSSTTPTTTTATTTTATTTATTTTPATTTTIVTTTSPSTTAPVYTVNLATSATLGSYLVDGKGRTLYYFTKDSPGVSNATAAIIANWPVFYAATITTSSAALNPADFGSITRSDGTMQTTFKSYPLYYYINDKAPGDTNGQGLNNVWFVVNPNNFNPTTSTTTSTTTTSSGY